MSGQGHTFGTGALRHMRISVQTAAPQRDALRAAWALRQERLWLGLIAVPLAEVATALSGNLWAWPLLVGSSSACLRGWRHWVMSVELGFVGVLWTANGANLLARYPHDPVAVGVAWTAFPIALAVAKTIEDRRRRNKPEAYFPLR